MAFPPSVALDVAVVLAPSQLGLHEDVTRLTAGRPVARSLCRKRNVMPLGPFFPLVGLVLPGLFGRDAIAP